MSSKDARALAKKQDTDGGDERQKGVSMPEFVISGALDSVSVSLEGILGTLESISGALESISASLERIGSTVDGESGFHLPRIRTC